LLNTAGTDNGTVGAVAANPVSISIEGPGSLREGESSPIIVKGTYFDGTKKTVSSGLVFRSENESIVSVRNGVIQAGKKGKARVFVSYNGLEASLQIHVKQMPPGQAKK
jgi:pectate disaccharide-lyase